jgi:hypothetical protein
MLFKRFLLFSIFFFASFLCYSQLSNTQVPIKKYEQQLLDIFFRDSTSSMTLKLKEGVFRFGFPAREFGAVSLVKNKKTIIIQLLGTGRIYQVIQRNKEYYFKRLDSTVHSGVNFEAFTFNRNDTLFQYGGSGFWKIRGFLTYYSKITHEWELLPSNKELTNYDDVKEFKFFKVDNQANKMYISGTILYTDFPTTLNAKNDDSCYVYDFLTHQWSTLGKMDPSLLSNKTRCSDLNFNNGHFCTFQKELEFYWLNFYNNSYGRLKLAKNNQIRLEWIGLYPTANLLKETYMQFQLGDSLYLATIKENGELYYKPIALSEKDFDFTNTSRIYDPINITYQQLKIIFNDIILPIVGLGILIFLIWFLVRRFLQRKKCLKK